MKKNMWKLLAAILSLAVLLSFSVIAVSADEPEDVTSTAEETTAPEETDAGTTSAETNAGDDSAKPAETTASGNSSGSSNSSSKKETHYGIVTLIIVAVILIGFAIWALRDRERSAKTWRSFKSEFKKIVWADKHETLKNTILVVIAIVVFAAVIGLIDYLLSTLIVTIGKLI